MRELNPLQRLHAEHDQSPWLDFVDRKLISWPRNPPYPHLYPQTSAQHAVEPANSLGLHGRHDVRTAVEGDGHAGVPQHLGHDNGVHPGGQQQRGGRVAVVAANGRQPFAPQQRSLAALGDARSGQRLAELIGKTKP